MALIEIDGLLFLEMVIFHGKLLVISRWYFCLKLMYPRLPRFTPEFWINEDCWSLRIPDYNRQKLVMHHPLIQFPKTCFDHVES